MEFQMIERYVIAKGSVARTARTFSSMASSPPGIRGYSGNPSKIQVLIKPIILQGLCMPQLLLEWNSTSPPQVDAWPKSSLFQRINFKWAHDFTIQGTGKVDGQGSGWWSPSYIQLGIFSPSVLLMQKKLKHNPDMKPTALRFYDSHNVTVRDIEIMNSPQCHLKFDSSSGIKVDNITINSPEISPNTDGIHLQNTKDVEIHHSNIGCGKNL
ncbi:hypothetical protein SADUNF_Sadunf10G0024400 [Salix dunnii]|uniref:Polygalacturonase n=1 Tax=Salix dunnii TaxID=1413687 RepID=A0A835JPC6_9ROSI|nr:hypothetical protein SADUNF_Sadunf10G0024400 [Salix dunnii]